MRRLVRPLLALSALVGVAALAFCAGSRVAPQARQDQTAPSALKAAATTRTEDDTSVVLEAWSVIQRNYYGALPTTPTLLSGAVQGLITALDDPFSAYQTSEQVASSLREVDGSLRSLGMAVEKRNGKLVVVAPLAGSPAQRAGVLAGDHIVAIDGRDAASLSLGEAATLLRGPSGSTVALAIARQSADVTITVQRGALSGAIVSTAMLAGDVLYVSIVFFDTTAARDLSSVLLQRLDSGLRGIVLDLRNNPGGYLDAAVEVAGQFIPDGIIVSQRTRTGVYVWAYKEQGKVLVMDGPDGKKSSPVRDGGRAFSTPLVVLVNHGTASAAEVVASALQDHNRAIVIGEQTFGKSAVTGEYILSDGSSIQMTNGQWFSPKGRSVGGNGLTPDILVADDPANPDFLVQQALGALAARR